MARVYIQQHSAFINPTNTFLGKSWFAPQVDIQGVHKVEDWTMWLVDVWVQFISNLEKTQRWHKENDYKHRKEQLSFKVGDQIWFQRWHIKITRPSEKLNHQKLSPFLIVKQINVVAFQLKFLSSMRIHLMFHIFFVRTL
jgi:hypothetical protein